MIFIIKNCDSNNNKIKPQEKIKMQYVMTNKCYIE